MRCAPIDLRESKVQIAQSCTHCDVGQIQVHIAAIGLVTKPATHGDQACRDFVQMAIYPRLRALLGQTMRPCLLHAHRQSGIQDAIDKSKAVTHLQTIATEISKVGKVR